jgi:hypothetical protein
MKPLTSCTKRTHFPRQAATEASAPARFQQTSPNAIISFIDTNALLHLTGLYDTLSSSSSMFSRLPARILSSIAIIIAVIVAGPA